ncbi:MAG TPA: gephyrin-like molybdotransferase Glp [Anaeromyxobacteraceae bacterium]|nr:gephyrin-like molybdotransferase Glp [Anaeromyxobacteraceae bacterium]
MLAPDEALTRILEVLDDLAPLPPVRVPLQAALGRALAEDLAATRSLPPFDASTVDGYAFRASDAPAAGARLPVAFEVFAGDAEVRALPPGACARVFTGAPLPAGADCVEMQEEVKRRRDVAELARAGERGRFRRAAGSDVSAGEVALARGAVVDPGAVGLAAALGRAELLVHRRPRVAILATGDELVRLGEAPGPGGIIDSNSHALAAACVEAGAEPLLLPLARDTEASLADALAAARGCDVLLTLGGVSVGERDLVRAALESAGAQLDFWRVAIRPGKPMTFGRWGATAVFGLPGNPVSALVTFEVFARPALRALAGLSGTGRTAVEARLAAAQQKVVGLTYFLRVRLREEGAEVWAEPLPSQSSGDLSSGTGFDALAVLPPDVEALRRGARVKAIVLRAGAHPRDSMTQTQRRVANASARSPRVSPKRASRR